MFYGVLEYNFIDVWSGFVCGYGYDNCINYDVYYFFGLLLFDICKFYS